MKKEIVVQSSVTVKQSKDFKKITHKAVAGLSEAELIERNTIGKLEEDDGDAEDKADIQ